MSLWRILINKLTKHSLYHFFIPLVMGLVGEYLVDTFITENKRWVGFFSGLFLSYGLIMYVLIRKERSKRIDEGALAKLQDTLDDAESFYGLSVIPLTQWFDPTVQVYLTKLLNRKLEPDDFEYERTFLFFSKREYKNALADLVDENHYGKCLAHMHRDCDIPLSFLQRSEIFTLLDQLTPREKEALGCYPRWTNWRFLQGLRRIPLRWLRRRISQLDFALVKSGSEVSVLRVSKRGEEVRIAKKIKGGAVEPFVKLVQLIREKVYDSNTKELLAEHDFVRNYGYENRVRRERELQSTTRINLDRTKWEVSYEIALPIGSPEQPEGTKEGALGETGRSGETSSPAFSVATVEFNQSGNRIVGEGRDTTGRRWNVEGAAADRRLGYIYFDTEGQRLSFGAVLLELDNSGMRMTGHWAGWAPESNELHPRRLTLTKLND